MSGVRDDVPWVDPAVIEQVYAQLQRRDRTRKDRRVAVRGIMGRSPQEFTDELDRLRVRMADLSDEVLAAKRGTPFADLADRELTLLEGALLGYEDAERFMHRNGVAEDARALAVLRANHVAGRVVVSGDAFRAVAVPFLCRCLAEAVAFADERQRMERMSILPPRVVAVLPWRAALLAAEAAQVVGVEHFWHLGVSRNERTLVPMVYHERRANEDTRQHLHVIVEPMLATGGTLGTVIERLRTRGVPMAKIVIASVVAAPEGVDRLLHRYADLRIVTAALDLALDARGYITGPGLGDFGDLAMDGVDAAYAARHWVQPGLITEQEATLVFRRTAVMGAAHAF